MNATATIGSISMKYCCIMKTKLILHLRHWQYHEANYTRKLSSIEVEWVLVRKEVVMSSIVMELVE